MVQTVIAYALVAVAAAGAAWLLFLRGLVRRRAKAKADCGSDCACGE